MKKFSSSILSFVLIAVVYGVGNLALVGSQKLWHHTDQANLDLLKVELNSEREAISSTKAKLQKLENEIQQIDSESAQLKIQIESVEHRDSSGISSELYASYKRLITHYNELASEHNSKLPAYKTLSGSYSAQIDAYNEKVKQANALGEKIGGTWYVIPRPHF
jgi:septal ring factor EnvC (AmiA/AmiB activator)